MNNNLTSAELAVISEIEATSSLLRLVTRLTGLRFAAIAKVTEASWTACAVYDEIQFGLEAGHQLKLEPTFCNELRLLIASTLYAHYQLQEMQEIQEVTA